MNQTDFENQIVDNITEMLPEGHTLTIRKVTKNNGIILHGLVINNGTTNISPTVYLDYYYNDYKEGRSIDELSSEVFNQYNKYKVDSDFDITVFTDFEKCKPNICYKLINYDKNRDLLEDIPHIVYLDLAIVFYCILTEKQFETSSILIKNSHMKLWDTTVTGLFDIASFNTPKKLKADIQSLSDIVTQIIARSGEEAEDEDMPSFINDSSMYVLTNQTKLYGATCLLYKGILKEFADKLNANLFIIPSSVHEVILVPVSDDLSNEYLTDLIREVNATELSLDEVLSDHVYLYTREDDAITY